MHGFSKVTVSSFDGRNWEANEHKLTPLEAR